ncbi:hypothetical protein BRADI_1g63273v3 [Brachypodium distachyon]|uniref:Uncharacterized protein n=1 Tax=Brachypodium distachyon TaxID=15368 RepID=A0A2K2DT65_BRADI|nr:hypothetical protein BRADI_1g63273v3 [Brachypodium distachyon]
MIEFLQLADLLAAVVLFPGREDVLRWKWSASGVYSAQNRNTMAHLLMGCAFTKAVLHEVLARVGALCCLPRPSEDLVAWLSAGARRLQGKVKVTRSLLNLTLWRIWKLRNACIFEGATPVVARLVEDIFVEADLWRAAEPSLK